MPRSRFPAFVIGTFAVLPACFTAVSCDRGVDPAAATASAPSEADVARALSAVRTYMNAGETSKAQAIAARLVERAPDEPRAREVLGQVLAIRAAEMEAAGDVDGAAAARREAWAHYDEATRRDAAWGLHQSAGMMAMAAGADEAALAHFLAAAQRAPREVQPPIFAAQVLVQMQRFEEAQRQVERAIEIDPDEPTAHATLAIIALERGDADAARLHMREAREIAPRDLALRAQEARIHRRLGDPRRAVELLAALLPEERADAAVTAELSASYAARGEPEKAAAAWAHRARIHPADPTAAARAGAAWLDAGRRDEALRWLERARAVAPAAAAVEDLRRRLEE